MTDHGKYPGQRGHAWRGDWHQRLLDIIGSRGFSTLTAFADARPGVSLTELAKEIGAGDVAAIQLQWTFVVEAQQNDTLERCARTLLVRYLREVPEGWPSEHGFDDQSNVRCKLIAWQGCLRREPHDSALALMTRTLLDATDIPAGWQPTGPDDPVIVAQFKRYWPNPELQGP